LNPEKWLKKLSDEKKAWLQAVVKYGWNAYMIVGICRVDKYSIRADKWEEQFHDLFMEGEESGSRSLPSCKVLSRPYQGSRCEQGGEVVRRVETT
jgi:hypothetical protein